MIKRLLFEIIAQNNSPSLGYQSGSVVHGALIERLDANWAAILHDNIPRPYSQSIYRQDNHVFWRINLLCDEFVEVFEKIFLSTPAAMRLHLHHTHGEYQLKLLQAEEYDYQALTEEYLAKAPQAHPAITFTTPASFRGNKDQLSLLLYPLCGLQLTLHKGLNFERKNALRIIYIVLFSLLFVCLAPFSCQAKNSDDTVAVYVQGSAIVYRGPLAEEGIERVKSLYSPKIQRLIIDSRGGEINLGMDLGDFVFAHHLDVEVPHYAFSSAANYVFPAGRNKYLHRYSQLGWHGGATQLLDSSSLADFKNPDELRQMLDYVDAARQREHKFFQKIGVQQLSTVYGQEPQFLSKDDYIGWRYSLAAMQQLGMKNIHLADGCWTPSDQFDGHKIFTIDTIKK